MARQVIDTTTNNGAYIGDPANVAFGKVNDNFAELYEAQDRLSSRTGKNKLINGTMNFWQRGTSFNLAPSAGAYTADRWAFNTGAGISVNVSRASLSPGEVDQFPLAMAVGVSAVGGGVNMRQSIELVNTMAGKSMTLSFWARANFAGMQLGVRGQQVFGSGGSANAGLTGGGNVSLNLAWTRHTVQLAAPSIAGKTAGANNAVQLIFDYLSSGTYWITGVQLEEGNARTDFDYPLYGDELVRCQRYYENSFPISSAPTNGAGSAGHTAVGFTAGAVRTQGIDFKVTKRANPSIVLYSPVEIPAAGGRWALYNGSAWSSGAASIVTLSPASFTTQMDYGSGITFGSSYITSGNWAADAEF